MSMPPEALETRKRAWMLEVWARLTALARDEATEAHELREEMLLLLAEYPDAPTA